MVNIIYLTEMITCVNFVLSVYLACWVLRDRESTTIIYNIYFISQPSLPYMEFDGGMVQLG